MSVGWNFPSNNYGTLTGIGEAGIETFRGLISALIELSQEINPDNARFEAIHSEATRYLNVLGGMYILDYFTSEEIHDKVIKHIKSKLAQFT